MKKLLVLAVLAFLVLSLGPLGKSSPAQPLKTLKLGSIPINDWLPLYVAVEKGFLREEGLTIELVNMASGALIMPAIAGGSLDLGVSSAYSLIMARAQGLDFKIVADSSYVAKESAVITQKDSNIRSYKDLEGKKVAINALKAVSYIFAKENMERQGGDVNKVHWVELPFPRMMAPLLNKEIDAAFSTEPFVTVMASDPQLRLVAPFFADVNPTGVIGEYISNEKWIKGNPDLVAKFARAIKRGVDYLNANLDEARGFLPKYTGISLDLAKKVNLPVYKKNIDVKQVQWMIDFMLKHEVIKKKLNADELIHDTAR